MTMTGQLLVYLDSSRAILSQISIISPSASNLPLVSSVNSLVTVKKCFLSGLGSRFASFSGGSVYVHSSSFADSQRPITMDENYPEPGSTATARCSYTQQALTLERVTFENLQGNEQKDPGGAVWFSTHDKLLNITACHFNKCWAAGSRWGDCVYSKGTLNRFIFNGCTVTNCWDALSIMHFQCGDTPNEYGELTLQGNTFKSCTVNYSMTEGGEKKTEGGGCGLVIRFPTKLTLVDCIFNDSWTPLDGGALFFEKKTNQQEFCFDNCIFQYNRAVNNGGAIALPGSDSRVTISNCVFKDNNVEATPKVQTGKGGFLWFSAALSTLTISDTEFKNGTAESGGCIFASTVSALAIDNVTIDACGARTSSAEHAMGKGRLVFGSSFTDMVTFSDCTFEQWGTEQFFSYESGGFVLNLTNCIFTQVTLSNGNFILVGKTNSVPIRDLYLTGCQFKTVQTAWALALRTGTVSGVCVVENCVFEGVVVSKDNKAEVILQLEAFSEINVSGTSFSDINGKNGLLLVGTTGSACSIDSVRFERCQITRPQSPGDHAHPCLKITGAVKRFNGCQFASCLYAQADMQPLLSISATIDGGLNGLRVTESTAGTNLVIISSGARIEFVDSWFGSLDLTVSPIRIDSTVDLAFSEASFAQVRVPDANLVGANLQSQTLELADVHIDDCAFASFAGPLSSLLLEDCEFRHSKIQNLASVSGTSAKLFKCQLENCTSQDPLLSATDCSNVDISFTTFQTCRSESSSLLVLRSVESFVLNCSCFQDGGPASELGYPIYVDCDCQNGTIELPVCFDEDANASVRFHGTFGEIPNIFNCHDCSFVPTPVPEPSEEVIVSSYSEESETQDEAPTETPDQTTTEAAEGGGLSGGEIAGIVIGVLILIAACVLIILFILLRKRSQDTEDTQDQREMAEEGDETVTSIMTGDEWIAKVTEDPVAAESTGGAMDGLYIETFEEIDY